MHKPGPGGEQAVHEPALQVWPLEHAFPQVPQFASSITRATHAPLQRLGHGFSQENPHFPPAHVGTAPGGDVHAVPHAPQFAGSVEVSLHAPPEHFVVPAGHTHCPPLQSAPLPQTVPQDPQLLALVPVSRHAPVQQSSLVPHAVPQAPQSSLSAFVSWHVPWQQAWSTGHELPQAPQLPVLVSRSVHAPVQHTSPAPQALPHEPQLFASVSRLVQTPLHVWRQPGNEPPLPPAGCDVEEPPHVIPIASARIAATNGPRARPIAVADSHPAFRAPAAMATSRRPPRRSGDAARNSARRRPRPPATEVYDFIASSLRHPREAGEW